MYAKDKLGGSSQVWGNPDWGYPDWGYLDREYPDREYPDRSTQNGDIQTGGIQTEVPRLGYLDPDRVPRLVVSRAKTWGTHTKSPKSLWYCIGKYSVLASIID